MYRLVVIGVSGCGKSVLERQIAARFGMPYVELDALYWGENRQAVSRTVFRARVQEATSSEAWVVDGNYSQSRDIVWSRATHVVWLDYGLFTIMWRVSFRTLRRLLSRQALWNGNRESLRVVFGRSSIVWYAFTSYRRHRAKYAALLANRESRHLKVKQFDSPKEASAWLQSPTLTDFH
jgi:adenylate kinase family enzyme